MPYDNSKTALATGPELRDSIGESTLTALLQCLMFSAHRQRRGMFRQAAVEGGWRPILCDDVKTARHEARRLATPLVVVDLYDEEDRRVDGAFRWLEQLTAEPGRLLAVVGSRTDPLDEVWARELGAWLFLPGASDVPGMAHVCSEARDALDQMAASSPPNDRARRTPGAARRRR